MTVADRLSDARLLWEAGRVDGALLNVLVAVAAAARITYPNERSDRRAFERFVSSVSRVKLSVEFRGKLETIEHVFYTWLRCKLVHEAAIPMDIQLVSDDDPETLSVRAGGAPHYVLKLSHGWFHHLFRAAAKVTG